jgi:hypothetical protein
MSANLQIYTKPTCLPSEELIIAGTDYDLTIGPNTGLDGDTGDRADMVLYIKNTGDKPAIDIRLSKDNDVADLAEFRLSSVTTYAKNNVSLGDLLPTEVMVLYVRVTVTKGTVAALVAPNFTFKFKSLP